MVHLLLTLVVGATPLSPSEVYKRAAPSVVVLIAPVDDQRVSQGSGVVLGPRTIVTNWHVVKEGVLVIVKTAPAPGREAGEVGVAILVAESAERDLAILHVLDARLVGDRMVRGAPTLNKARVADADVEVGQKVFAIGSPRGLELSLSDGLVSQMRSTKAGTLIQTTAAISHGSSGGGLFNSEAQLVGLTTSSLEDGQSLNFAIPAHDALPIAAGGFSARGAERLCAVPAELRAELLKQFDARTLRSLNTMLGKATCESDSAPEAALPSVGPPLVRRSETPPVASNPTREAEDSAPAVVAQEPPSTPVPSVAPVVSVSSGIEAAQPAQVKERTVAAVELHPPPEPPLVAAAPAGSRRLAWIPTIAAGVLLAAGGVFYGFARGAEANLRSPTTEIGSEAEAERVARAGRDYQTASFVLLGAGALAAVTAVTMFLLQPSPDETTVSAFVLPSGFAVGVSGFLP